MEALISTSWRLLISSSLMPMKVRSRRSLILIRAMPGSMRSMSAVPPDQLQEFLPRIERLAETAEHHRRHHRRVLLLHAAHHHAHVTGFDDHRHALGVG